MSYAYPFSLAELDQGEQFRYDLHTDDHIVEDVSTAGRRIKNLNTGEISLVLPTDLPKLVWKACIVA